MSTTAKIRANGGNSMSKIRSDVRQLHILVLTLFIYVIYWIIDYSVILDGDIVSCF